MFGLDLRIDFFLQVHLSLGDGRMFSGCRGSADDEDDQGSRHGSGDGTDKSGGTDVS